MDRQQVRLSALRCGNEYKSPVWLPLSSARSLPLFLFLQLFHPFPFSYLSLFGLEIAQSVIWGLAFCPAQPLPRHADLSVVLYVHVP